MEKRTILLPYTPEEFRHLVEDSVEKVLKETFSEKPKKRYVKIDQLATQYGWPKKTIYGWVHQEQIPYLKPGYLKSININHH